MSKKEKLQFYRALLIALSLSTSNPSIAYAKDNESANQDYPSWFNTLIEYSEKAEEIVNENFVNPLINKTDDLRYDCSDNGEDFDKCFVYSNVSLPKVNEG